MALPALPRLNLKASSWHTAPAHGKFSGWRREDFQESDLDQLQPGEALAAAVVSCTYECMHAIHASSHASLPATSTLMAVFWVEAVQATSRATAAKSTASAAESGTMQKLKWSACMHAAMEGFH